MINLLLDNGAKPFYKNKVNRTIKKLIVTNNKIVFLGRVACRPLCLSLEPAIRSETLYWAKTVHTNNEQFQVFIQAYQVNCKCLIHILQYKGRFT